MSKKDEKTPTAPPAPPAPPVPPVPPPPPPPPAAPPVYVITTPKNPGFDGLRAGLKFVGGRAETTDADKAEELRGLGYAVAQLSDFGELSRAVGSS